MATQDGDRAAHSLLPGVTVLHVWPAVVFALLLSYKLYFVVSIIDSLLAEGYTAPAVIGRVVAQDVGLFALVFLIFHFLAPRLPLVGHWLVWIICLVYFADLFASKALFRRLTLLNVYRFYDEPHAISSFATPELLIALLTVLSSAYFCRKMKIIVGKRISLGFFSSSVLLAFLPWVDITDRHTERLFTMTANIVRINQAVLVDRNITHHLFEQTRNAHPAVARRFDEIIRNYYAGYPPVIPTDGGSCPVPNVIVLISESLSQVDSSRSTGVFDRLPLIDKIQADGLTLTNAIADGSSTAEALASLLTGIEQLPTPLLDDSMLRRFPPCKLPGILRDRDERCPSLPALAKRAGFRTLFVTSSPLGFQDTGVWLQRVGFEHVEGSDGRFFSTHRRFTFNAPEDRILYQRVEEIIGNTSSPFLMVVLTTSLHFPLILPDDVYRKTDDPLLNQLSYVDATTYEFYRTLDRIGFFKTGILLLVGDHRRMAPFEPEEFRVRRKDGYGRVVASFVGRDVPRGRLDNTALAHSDLYNILAYLIKGGADFPDDLSRFNRGSILGIGEPFTVHLSDYDYGTLVVRRKSEEPFFLTFPSKSASAESREDSTRGKTVAYLLMKARWIGDYQSR